MIRSNRRAAARWYALGGLALCLLLASPALADPGAADIESGKAAYREGRTLREHGDLAGALARFKAAYALVPTPITALEVGKTQIALGHLVEAREVLTSIDRLPKKPDESTKAADARTEAAQLATELTPKLASLTVSAAPGETEAPSVNIDGADIPKDAAHSPRVVDPGHHVIKVHGKGASAQLEIDVKEGEQRAVDVPLIADAPVSAPAPVIAPTSVTADVAPAEQSKGKLVLSPLVWGGFGVGAVGVVVGGITGAIALGEASTVKSECPNGQCPPAAHGDLNLTNAMSTTSTIAFVVGALGVGVGVVGLFMSKREPANTVVWLQELRVGVGPGTLSMRGAW